MAKMMDREVATGSPFFNWVRGEHLQHNILYTCTTSSRRGHEQLVIEHSLGYLISGEIHFHTNKGLQVIGEGSMGIIRKNELAKSVKIPPPGGEMKAINILLTQEHLRRYAAEHDIPANRRYQGEPMLALSDDPFLKGYFDSLIPYFEHPGQLTQAMTDLKTFEAIELLLRRPGMRDLLFDFTEPFKIDLEAFMNTNYKYNIPLNNFARLSGRSLATFKRDFRKTFNLPPERWLHQKRLETAHYLISQLKQPPADVYLEVGFENISHFSASFKKHFGYNASSISS
jgi:AraC-like DNA-binding protein